MSVLRGLGPQPRWVYWVRRGIVGLGLFLLFLLIWALFFRGGGGDDPEPGGDADAQAQGTEGADGADGADATDGATTDGASVDADAGAASRTCQAADLQLALTGDATSYAADGRATFTVAITNIGASSCTVDAGSASLEVLVTSGADRIWSSVDCAVEGAEGSERMLLLSQGAQEAAAVPWELERSDEMCTADLPAPRAGTYHAVAKLLGAESGDLVFTIE